jgi:hypothetical protein
MAPRACLPGELYLDAIVMDPLHQITVLAGRRQNTGDWAVRDRFNPDVTTRAREQGRHIALRWVLNPALGIPLAPFTVWRRATQLREAMTPITGWHKIGHDTFGWDGVTEFLRIELEVSAPVTAQGLTRADPDGRPVTTVSAPAGKIVLQGGPMVGVRVDNPGAVIAARGLSTVTMANGSGWKEIEVVGLPFGPDLSGSTYYAKVPQGRVGALTDPVSAAVQRLARWGPVLGWAPLAGLPPWQRPDPAQLVKEMQGDVLGGLAKVLKQAPPPLVDQQQLVEVRQELAELRQIVGSKVGGLNGAGDNQRSEIRARPLQGLTTSVATDSWASLALGFGTGAEISPNTPDDFMVTAPWRGTMSLPVQAPWPWPWGDSPDPVMVSKEVDRELAAVVLAPEPRSAPHEPTPIATSIAFAEGAPMLDEPYHCASVIRTTRPPALSGVPRVAAYGLGRFDGPATGHYSMRQHPLAKGWIPVGSAVPVRQPGHPADPALHPDSAMLRDSGIEMPVTGADKRYQYAVAATDLFGQWSHWSAGWLSVGPAKVQVPRVAVLRAQASPGTNGADPCRLVASVEVVWDRRERSCSRMEVVVDVFDPTPAPPHPLADPPDAPQPAFTLAGVEISFDADGNPLSSPAGVSVVGLHEDDTPVTSVDPFTGDERRYRITFTSLAVTYGGADEKAVAVYVQAEETIRPDEWSGWSHAREAAIAPNPLPPPVPVPLTPEFPLWASLPNAAGESYAPVTWTPTGAWRYRVYEATEAALLAVCGEPGPTLTDGYGERMHTLFGLYADKGNWTKLRSAYRKLGTEPVAPPVQPDGTMRVENLLPRGSGLIHCYVVVGVTKSNVVSAWPEPDGTGRNGFLAYAIPKPLRPAQPEILARHDKSGEVRVTVRADGAVPATKIRLYRAANALLARNVGTMQLIATVDTDPAGWHETEIVDTSAPHSWSRLQYRAVAVTDDDPDRAGMAVASPPSKSYALLNPPPNPPTLSLTSNMRGSTATMSLVRVTTDAPHSGTEAGDHRLAFVATPFGGAPVRSSMPLAALPHFTSVAEFVARGVTAGVVGTRIYLRLNRAGNQRIGLTVDVTDPLGRGRHTAVEVPANLSAPDPVLSNFTVGRNGSVATISVDTNVPLPPDPANDWTFRVTTRVASLPATIRTFDFSDIVAIRDADQMPDPATVPDTTAIRRVDGRVLMWVRTSLRTTVVLQLTNSDNQSTSAQKVTP